MESKEFVPIRLRTLRTDEVLGFAVYLKMSHRFLLYVRDEDEFDLERFNKLKKKKVRQLFILGTQEAKYQNFLDKTLMSAANDPNMNETQRADIMSAVTSDAMEKLKEAPESEEAFREIEKAGRSMIEIVNKNPKVLAALFGAESDEDITVTSAINTCSLSLRVAKLLAFDHGLLEVIGTGALLRDISISKMEPRARELYILPMDQFTAEDLELYKQHPELSVEMVQSLSTVTKQIKDIIRNHEEKKNGQGLKGIKTLTIQEEIVALCSLYDRYVTALKMAPAKAIEKILTEERTAFNPDYIKKLQIVLKESGLVT